MTDTQIVNHLVTVMELYDVQLIDGNQLIDFITALLEKRQS